MDDSQPTSSPTDATLRVPPPGTAGTADFAKSITLPTSVADQVTVAAGIHGSTQDGLSRPTFRARYEMGQELGHGGMGVVYAASDRDLGRTVAMKVMQPEVTGSKEHAARFLREVQTTAQLEHPNIMPVYDVGISDEGCLFYTMKLVHGKTLSAALRGLRERHEDHSIPRLLDMFLQVCNGVTYAHAKGVLHRDLKPDNVMLGEHGEVVVMDWGLAKVFGSVEGPFQPGAVRTQSGGTLAGTVVGTPAYMAPEQARAEAESIGPHTDVYALGAILYEMLTLRAPFVGTDSLDILAKVLRGEPPAPPRALNAAVGKPLNAIVKKAMSADPGERYPGAETFAEDVRRFLEGKPVTAYAEGIGDKLARGMRRYRRRILLATSVAVVCLVGVAGLLFAGRKQGERRALELLEKAKTASRGIRDATAPFDLRMGAYSDARRLCDRALSQAPHLDAAQRMRTEVILEFAQAAAERREFDLAQTLTLELEAQAGRWEDLGARVVAMGKKLADEERRVRAALDEVFSQVRNREIELVFSEEGDDSLPEAVESAVGTLRGRWSIDACLARLREEREEDAVRAVAALLLARYGAREEGVLTTLRAGLAPGTPATVLVACAEALGALGDAGAVPLLLARLADAIPDGEEEEDPYLQLIGPMTMMETAGVPVTHRLGAAIARYGSSVAPDVEKALLGASASPNARTVGYLLLARCGGAPAMRGLVRAAKDPSVGGLVLARELVGEVDPSTVAPNRAACDALLEGLSDGNRDVRGLFLSVLAGANALAQVQQAVTLVFQQGGAHFSMSQEMGLSSLAWPEDVRRKGVEVASEMAGGSSDPSMRLTAIRVLAIGRTREAERELVRHVGGDDPVVQRLALAGLANASPEVVPDLLLVASVAEADLRSALVAIGEASLQRLRWGWKPERTSISAEAKKVILEGLSKEGAPERVLCVGAAGLFGVGAAREALEEILCGTGEAPLRRRAAWALGRLGDPACLPRLQGLLRSETEGAVREGVALALARFRRPEALTVLVEALRRRDYASALNLRAAIREIVGGDVRPLMDLAGKERADTAWVGLVAVIARVPGEASAQALAELASAERKRNPARHLHAEALLFELGDASRLSSVLSALAGGSEELRGEARRILVRWFRVDCGSEAGRWKDWWEQNRGRLQFDPETESYIRVK